MFNRDELLAQARRRYPEFLRSVVEDTPFFPLEMRVGKTRRAANYVERVAELKEFRVAAAALGIIVEWSAVNDPRFGPHERPDRAYFADEESFLRALGCTVEVRAFREDCALIAAFPALQPWLADNAGSVLAHHGAWPRLLRVLEWFHAHPQSGLYLRQIPVPGVDTKFFEQRLAVIDALLLQTMPSAIEITAKRFEARHGLRWEQPLIRLRFLDPALQSAHGFPIADLAVPAPTFRGLPLQGVNAIITENLRNFLALPPLPCTVAIFGSGDAAALLADAPWLVEARIFYWGDLDPRGYAILARLRKEYPATESVLMDTAALNAHRSWTGSVATSTAKIDGLLPGEAAALEQLCLEGLWLEQERVPFVAVVEILTRLTRLPPPPERGITEPGESNRTSA